MLRTEIVWSGVPGAPYYTALHFAGESAAEAEGAWAATDQLLVALDEWYRDDLTGTVQPEVSVVDPVTGLITATYLESSGPHSGGVVADSMPLLIQGLVRLRTGVYVNGREIRGRFFVPGTADIHDDDGVPSSAYQTGLTTIFQNLITDTTTLGIPLQVWSPTNGVAENVTGASAWNQWAVLRSRRD